MICLLWNMCNFFVVIMIGGGGDTFLADIFSKGGGGGGGARCGWVREVGLGREYLGSR